jgi:hypothetical protein
MTQIARNVTDGVDGFLKGKRYLIHDRDPLYTRVVRKRAINKIDCHIVALYSFVTHPKNFRACKEECHA